MKITAKQVKWLKVFLHLCAALPLAWLILSIMQGWLSADPIKDIYHYTGRMALKLLLATLLVSPLIQLSHQRILIRCRRLLGLWTFFWATLHLLSYTYFELGLDLSMLIREVTQRFYLMLGFISWIILLILTITSFPRIQKRCARYWQFIHNFVYVVLILASMHALLSTKLLSIDLVCYAIAGLILLAFRYQKFISWIKSF